MPKAKVLSFEHLVAQASLTEFNEYTNISSTVFRRLLYLNVNSLT